MVSPQWRMWHKSQFCLRQATLRKRSFQCFYFINLKTFLQNWDYGWPNMGSWNVLKRQVFVNYFSLLWCLKSRDIKRLQQKKMVWFKKRTFGRFEFVIVFFVDDYHYVRRNNYVMDEMMEYDAISATISHIKSMNVGHFIGKAVFS